MLSLSAFLEFDTTHCPLSSLRPTNGTHCYARSFLFHNTCTISKFANALPFPHFSLFRACQFYVLPCLVSSAFTECRPICLTSRRRNTSTHLCVRSFRFCQRSLSMPTFADLFPHPNTHLHFEVFVCLQPSLSPLLITLPLAPCILFRRVSTPLSDQQKDHITKFAINCPVKQALREDMKIPATFTWADGSQTHMDL